MLTTINHIALAVRDLKSATERYRVLLGSEPVSEPAREPARDGDVKVRFQLSNVALAIASHDDARQGDGIRSLGFSTPDLAKARHRLQRCGVGVDAEDEHTIVLATSATHGARIEIVERPSDAVSSPAAVDRSTPIVGLDHIVISTSHPERAAALYGARLGLEMKLDRTNPDWGSRLMFFKCGDAIVEIAHSLKNADPNASDKLWGVSWRTDNIDAANARLAQAGFNVSEIRAGRKPGTRVFTVRDAPGGVPTLVIGQERAR